MDRNLGQRKTGRCSLKAEAFLYCEGVIWPVRVLNLSAGGFFALSQHLFPVGTRLRLKLELDSFRGDLFCEAEVAWNRAAQDAPRARFYPLGMGLRFLPLSPLLRRALDQYVNTRRNLSRLDTRIGAELKINRR